MTTAFNDRGVIPELTMGQRLQISREYVHMTQGELAKSLGVSLATVQRAETGRSNPRRTTILAWAMATGVNAFWLETGKTPTGTDPDGGESVGYQGLEPRTR